MRLLRQSLVLALLVVGAFVVAWLLGTGTLAAEGNLGLLLAVGLEALAGLIAGYLLRSWWAALTVPLAILFGVALESLVQYGSLWQGAAVEVVPIAILVLPILIVPAAIGALIGTPLGMRVVSHA